MIDAKNVVALTGGIVADPERPTDNLVKLRVAVDYAASEKDSDNNSGYFSVTYWLNGEGVRNAGFVKSQLDAGNLKKGSQISILGRLVQERWKDNEGQSRSQVSIVAESITYASSGPKTESSASSNGSPASIPAGF